jgi:outer membrane protein assembly factor BamB
MAEGGRGLARRSRDALQLLLHPRRLWHEHRPWAIGLIVAAVALVAGGVIAYEALKRPGDVHNEDVINRFEEQKPPPAKEPKTVNWPIYGYDLARTRYLPVKGVKPPFRKIWRFTDRPLLEFPPIYVGGKLYFVNNNGFAHALDADTGKVLWKRRIGQLNASSPAYYKSRLYIVNLVPGHIVKLDAKTGKTIWKRDLPGRAESSPVVIGRTIYFGCENGELFAMSTGKGQVRWSTPLGGPIKAAPAYYGGKLFVGDYGGYMNAVDAKSGKLVWQSGSLGPGFGGSGAFYSTPAVAGGYAYSGPAVANTKHSPPTVFIGSFDGNVYALDAKDGGVRWSRSAGGQVIGSLSAVGDIVYVAEFTDKTTSGFMMRSGKRVFRYPYGTYTPVISDGRRIYLTGYSSITALQPFKHRIGVAGRIEAPRVKAKPPPQKRTKKQPKRTKKQSRKRANDAKGRRQGAAAAASERPARKKGSAQSEGGRGGR